MFIVTQKKAAKEKRGTAKQDFKSWDRGIRYFHGTGHPTITSHHISATVPVMYLDRYPPLSLLLFFLFFLSLSSTFFPFLSFFFHFLILSFFSFLCPFSFLPSFLSLLLFSFPFSSFHFFPCFIFLSFFPVSSFFLLLRLYRWVLES